MRIMNGVGLAIGYGALAALVAFILVTSTPLSFIPERIELTAEQVAWGGALLGGIAGFIQGAAEKPAQKPAQRT